MSIRERLLGSVSAFLLAMKSDSLDDFNSDFLALSQDMEERRTSGRLSLEDQQLGAEVSRRIETMAETMGNLDSRLSTISTAFEGDVDARLAEDDCSASCSQPHSHSTGPIQRSPTPTSPPTHLHPHSRSHHSNDSGSEDDSDSDNSPKNNNNKKTGPENPANFRHLRDWFLANMAHPFPTSVQKKELAAAKGLPLNSINLWFTNMRRRSGWTAAQQKFASSDSKLMVSLVTNFSDPTTQATMPADVVEELNRIQGYIDERGQERVRDYMITVIEDGLEAGKHVPDDEWDEDEDGGEEGEDGEGDDDEEEEPEEFKVYEGGAGGEWESGGLKRKASGEFDELDEEDDVDASLGLGGRGSKRGRVEGGSFLPSSLQSAADTIRKSSNNSTSTSASFAFSEEALTPLSSFDGHSPENHVSPVEESPYAHPIITQQPQQLGHSSRIIAPIRRTSNSRGIAVAEQPDWSSTGSPQLQHQQQQQHIRSSSASSSLRIVSGGSGSSGAPLPTTPEELDFGHQVSPTRRTSARRDDEFSYDRYQPPPPQQHQSYYPGPSSHPRHASDSSFSYDAYPPQTYSSQPRLQPPHHQPHQSYPSSSSASSSRYQQTYAPQQYYDDERDRYAQQPYPPPHRPNDASSSSSSNYYSHPPPPSSDRYRRGHQQQPLYNHQPLQHNSEPIPSISRPKKKRAVTQPQPQPSHANSSSQRSLSYNGGNGNGTHSVLSPPMGFTDQNATYFDQGATGGRGIPTHNPNPPYHQQAQPQPQPQPERTSMSHARKDSSGSLGSSSALSNESGHEMAARQKREVFLAKKERLRLEREELDREERELGSEA